MLILTSNNETLEWYGTVGDKEAIHRAVGVRPRVQLDDGYIRYQIHMKMMTPTVNSAFVGVRQGRFLLGKATLKLPRGGTGQTDGT